MTPKRLPQGPPERPKTETNRSKSAPKVSRSTFRFWCVRVISAMFSPRAQKRRAQRPGGFFLGSPRAPKVFSRGPRRPFWHPKTSELVPGTPFGRLRGCWGDFGLIFCRFWVDFGSIWGSILGPFLEPSEEFSVPLFPPPSLIGATMERSIDR